MNNDMSDMMKNLNSMLEGNKIPDNVKDALGSLMKNSGNSTNTDSNLKKNNEKAEDSNSNIDLDSIIKILKNNTKSSPNSSSNNDNEYSKSSDNSSSNNIDINTILKMQEIVKSMNSESNSSRSNLLRSLKPYLKPSRQEKVDQYIQLFNMEKVFKMLNNNGKV